ncbi:MAG: PPC domain-containing protein [Deinococcota bacterium]
MKLQRLVSTLVILMLTAALAQRTPHYLTITAPLLEAGTTYSGSLDETDGQNFKDGSRIELLQIFGFAGDIVELEIISEFDSYLSIYDADGELLMFNDDSNDVDAFLSLTLPETSRYRVIVSGYSEFDVGAYDLIYTKLDASTMRDGGALELPDRVSGMLDTSDDFDGDHYFDSYELTLSDSQDVFLELSSTMFDAYIFVIDADDYVIGENDDGSFSTDSELFLSLEPGTYEVVVSSFGFEETGPYELFVSVE